MTICDHARHAQTHAETRTYAERERASERHALSFCLRQAPHIPVFMSAATKGGGTQRNRLHRQHKTERNSPGGTFNKNTPLTKHNLQSTARSTQAGLLLHPPPPIPAPQDELKFVVKRGWRSLSAVCRSTISIGLHRLTVFQTAAARLERARSASSLKAQICSTTSRSPSSLYVPQL